jgi:hypothetical protein
MTPMLRLPVLIAALLMAAAPAVAQPATQTPQEAAAVIENWGLIGSWSQDCRRAPQRGAALLTYTKASDGSVIRTATTGGKPNTSRILAARVIPDGSIEITEKDPDDVLVFVLSKAGSGKHRSMSSRDDKGYFYIRNGKFTDDGKETALMSRCTR